MEVKGAIHIHTVYSDGSGTVQDVVEAAKEADLDFIILTDHDTLQPLYDYGRKFVDGLFVGFGVEVSPERNHYLALGIEKNLPPNTDLPQVFIDKVNEGGGFGFLLHPLDRGSRVLKIPDYAWTEKDVHGHTGLEVWNMMSDLVGSAESYLKAVRVVFFPRRYLRGPDPNLLAWWDELNLKGPVPGFGGQDVHAYHAGPLVIYPYRKSFGMLLTHLEVDETPKGDAQAFEKALYASLKAGRGYFCNHAQGHPKGFSFKIGGAGPGEKISFSQGLKAQVSFPGRAAWTLIGNGKVVSGNGPDWEISGPGVYRLEGRIKGRPWLFTNHIRVTP